MEDGLRIKENVIVPHSELEVTASRSGGAGGQHVNRASTRITVRWNVKNSNALSDEQKQWVLKKLENRLTTDGDLIIHNSESRSQQHNKKLAFDRLVDIIRRALHVPKKRMKTRVSQLAIEKRLQEKSIRSDIKKTRSNKNSIEEY